MKNSVIQLLLLLFLAIFSKTVFAETLTFGYSEACPHMCPDNEQKGFTHDITKTILEKFGHNVTFNPLPWSRAVHFANEGKINGVICTSKAESPLLIYPKLEHGMQNDCFYGDHDDNWQPKDMESFLERRTIVFNGWMHGEDYVQRLGVTKYYQLFLEFSLNNDYTERAIMMIERDRAEAFWHDSTTLKYFLSKNAVIRKRNTIKKLGCIKRQKLFMGMSPKHPELAKKINLQFDQGMKELRISGELEEIMKRYGLTDWQ